MMLWLAPYVMVEHLHQGAAFTLERARDEADGSTVVLKRLAADRSTPGERARIQREYEILRSLDLQGVPEARALVDEAGALTLVLADFGGQNLAAWLQAAPRTLRERLAVAVRLAAIVGELHRRGVIHKDIKPRNILVDPDGNVQLIDFGIATRVPRELPALRGPTVLEGTLAYIAPEQTGRMNRAVDHRSDLYSLGATLYEMLLERPPFIGDPLELIHAHIARAPVPPATRDPQIPVALSEIVVKLLAKAAEDRYRSAFGLAADLTRCLDAMMSDLSPGTFPLGQDDPDPGFAVPERLFGRAAEISALAQAHARVRGGACELALVTGPAGVGKTAVIRELHRELAGGACVAGKFDQLRRDQPYSAVREALAQLVDSALAASEEGLAHVRWELEQSLGKRGGALLELLPGAVALLGPRVVAERASHVGLTAAAARSQTHQALLGLVRAFSGPRRPLVLELDDLQWADAASLELLTALLTDAQMHGLLVVGSYRDDEVGADHPLRRAVATISASGCRVTELVIDALEPEAVAALCAATLARPEDDPELRALAALVHDRCGGIPLLCGELLRDLDRDGLVQFSPARRGFTWDLARVAASASSADVVRRMVERGRELGDEVLAALHLAACRGGSFTADELQVLTGRPLAAIEAALTAATTAGLLVVDAGRHRFFHDRVQQAILGALTPAARARNHLTIARHLGTITGEHTPFERADQYNLALGLLDDRDERRAVAELDLGAARRARGAGAFAAVVAYASAGLVALPPGPGAHALAHPLGLLRAEGLFVTGDFGGAETAFAALLASASDDSERAAVYDRHVGLLVHMGKLHEAQALGLAGLRSLGLDLHPKPGVPTLIAEFVRTRAAIGRRSPADLLTLPVLKDEGVRQILKLIGSISSAAFQIDFALMAQLALRSTRMTLTHGNSPLAAAEFVSYGLIIGAVTRDNALMNSYGRAALTLLERLPDRGIEALVRFLYGGMMHSWCYPIRESFAGLRIAHQCGVDTGNLLIAGLALAALQLSMWQAGCAIDQVQAELERTLAFARRARLPVIIGGLAAQMAQLGAFSGRPGPAIGAAEHAELTPDREHIQRHVRWHYRIELAVHTGEDPGALADAEQADGDIERVMGMSISIYHHHAYRALLLATDHGRRGLLGRGKAERAIAGCLRKMTRAAALQPVNFDGLLHLVEAEYARIRGDEGAAIRLYDRAADDARAHGFVQHEALACMSAARFYLGAGLEAPARPYLVRARQAYLRWGATARASALDRAHPGLERWAVAAGEALANNSTVGSATPSAGTTVHLPLALDFASLFKATQVFSEEIELDRLLDKIMAILVENAGAERGVLLLERGQGLVGARSFAIADPHSVDLGGVPLASCPGVPVALVLYVQRTGKAVAIADLGLDARFADDPHVRAVHPRSALCAPLVHRGQRLGALYLENNLSAGVFDHQRLETLNVLAVQAAIAIEHVFFYTRLDAARQAAETANIAKTRFLANMSHELRTPLNAILGYSELLAEEAESRGLGEMVDDCARVREAGVQLLGLISDILDLTKIEAERLELVAEPIVLASLLTEVVGVFGPELARGKHRLIQERAEDLGTMTGDPIRIRQILLNLLGNALKFGVSARGGTITLRALRDSERVYFAVADSGPGMSEEQAATIFEPFTQVDASATRRRDGAGLGLAICRSLCEHMGGKISVISAPGLGSTFRVELPLRPPSTLVASL